MARKSGAETPVARHSIDWRYVCFYALFYVCLILIGLFGVMAEV